MKLSPMFSLILLMALILCSCNEAAEAAEKGKAKVERLFAKDSLDENSLYTESYLRKKVIPRIIAEDNETIANPQNAGMYYDSCKVEKGEGISIVESCPMTVNGYSTMEFSFGLSALFAAETPDRLFCGSLNKKTLEMLKHVRYYEMWMLKQNTGKGHKFRLTYELCTQPAEDDGIY